MQLKVNGSDTEYQGLATLSALVEFLGMNPKYIAVELNSELVRRKLYDQTSIADGDILEIVTLVGGG